MWRTEPDVMAHQELTWRTEPDMAIDTPPAMSTSMRHDETQCATSDRSVRHDKLGATTSGSVRLVPAAHTTAPNGLQKCPEGLQRRPLV